MELDKILDEFLKGRFDLAKFNNHRDRAKSALTEWRNTQVAAELGKAHRAGGTTDFDNATDEYIDERIAELKPSKEPDND